MNGNSIPEGNVDWLCVKESRGGKRWAVEERTEIFVAYLVAVLHDSDWVAPDRPENAVVFWSSQDAAEAQSWLRDEAEKDYEMWEPCTNCGKVMHATKAPIRGFCCRACQTVAADHE